MKYLIESATSHHFKIVKIQINSNYLFIIVLVKSTTIQQRLEMPISWLVGFIFGIGLATSGMWRRTKIKNFLTLYEDWDPSLMLVMCGAVGINLITFPLIIHKMKKPVWAKEIGLPKKKSLDLRLIFGAGIFGLGWGLGSIWPGPGMIDFFLVTHWIVWLVSLAIGQLGWDLVEKLIAKHQASQKVTEAK